MTPTVASPVPAAPAAVSPVLWATAAVVAVAFFLTNGSLLVSRNEVYGQESEVLEQSAADGNWSSRAGFSLLALWGGFLLARKAGRAWRPSGVLPLLMLFYLAWCLASVCWTIDVEKTIRAGGALVFCAVGALGVARQATGRQLCLLALVVAALCAAFGCGVECALGTFRPFSPDYRFAGTLHPNGQGANCAILCLAAFLLLRGGTRGRVLLFAVLLAGVVLLLLTRSRTACAGLAAAGCAVACLRPTARLGAVALVLVCLLSGLVLLTSLSGIDVADRFGAALLMGRPDDPATLSGRTDLWAELADYARLRPQFGYGYGAFWTAEHIREVSSTLYWGINSAHSVYLEAVLAIGLVGAAALVLTLAAGLCRAAVRYWRIGDPGTGLLVALLVYGLVEGFSEADIIVPSFETFLLACGLCGLSCFSPDPPSPCGNQGTNGRPAVVSPPKEAL